MDLGELVQKAIDSIDRDTEPLGKGDDGVVYVIDEEVVLKLHHGRCRPGRAPYFSHGSSQKSAEHEFEIGLNLYQQGIQVPQFFGMFEPRKNMPFNCWGIFMERVYGVKYKALPLTLKREAKHQFNIQKRLIDQQGYKPTDSYHDHNTLFSLEKRKLYFHDFVGWERLS